MNKLNVLTLIAALACVAPACADESAIVAAGGEEETQEEVVINQDCGCTKGKDKKPKE